MSTLSLRLPNSLHDRIRELAEAEGVSINQFIATAAAEKMAALMTDDYLAQRGRRASREKFQKALSRIPDRPADPEDEF
ncbi:MAG: YlcI/YnfO family protein [Rhodothermia bacterium]